MRPAKPCRLESHKKLTIAGVDRQIQFRILTCQLGRLSNSLNLQSLLGETVVNRPMRLLVIAVGLLLSETRCGHAQTLVFWNGGNGPAAWNVSNTNWNTVAADPWSSTNGSNYRAYFTTNNSTVTVDNAGVYTWDLTVGNSTTPTIEGRADHPPQQLGPQRHLFVGR